MNKATKITYNGGMNKDISKSKFQPQFYFEGKNIRIIATDSQSTGSVTNEKGNSFLLQIPIPQINYTTKTISYSTKTLQYTTNEINNIYNSINQSVTQKVIGHSYIKGYFILFTTDDNGFDCIWKFNEITYDLTLLYLRDLNFSTNFPIQVVSNYENDNIIKVYWVDGINQLRYININHLIENQDLENLIDLNSTVINQVGDFLFSQPKVISILNGGLHTSGMIQYAYNLYKVNGSQTKISPLSEIISLDKGLNGGGLVNEEVGSSPVVSISDIDSNYTNLKLYSIKYTSYNQLPEISLILDTNITDNPNFTYVDDGRVIQTISLENFLFLGSDIVIPKHIASKKNRLFLANYKEKNYDVDLDCRAYSFLDSTSVTPSSVIADSFTVTETNILVPFNPLYLNALNSYNYDAIPKTHSAINIDYNTYKYTLDNNLGGEGKYIKYELIRTQNINNLFTKRFFKDDEIYRIGIEFYNNYGQNTLPKWIADFKCHIQGNNSNLNGYYAGIKLTLKPEFYVWLNDNSNFLDENGIYDEKLKPIGYKILRADRTILDRTIICQGLINPSMSVAITKDDENPKIGFGQIDGNYGGLSLPTTANSAKITEADNGYKIPSLMRRFDNYLNPMWATNNYAAISRHDAPYHPQTKLSPLGLPIGNNTGGGSKEIYDSVSSSDRIANTRQYNSLMNLYSPEILFDKLNNISNSEFRVIGGIVNNDNSSWGQIRKNDTKEIITEIKTYNSISYYDLKAVDENLIDIGQTQPHNIGVFGLVQALGSSTPRTYFNQFYRSYRGNFIKNNDTNIYNFYGQPIVAEKGQGRTVYNNDNNYVFYNSWESLITDGGIATDDGMSNPVKSVNSWGAKCLTFVLGANNILPKNRVDINNLYLTSTINNSTVGLISEVIIPNNQIYVGNIYGGNTYEAKKRTNYIEIGEYKTINNNINTIVNPGDTYISDFTFAKLSKTDTEIYDVNIPQFTEIVSVRLETTIDLENRSDESLKTWDTIFQPRYDNYHNYNDVYSQQPNFIIKRDLNYNFKRQNEFSTNIIATRAKTAGELIDSWTDIQPNEVMTLDGKHGPINNIFSFKDNLFTHQDFATAYLSISPRVQVQGSDGLSVELGTGQVLQDYQYLSTEYGSVNKWSTVVSPLTFYFYDNYNKCLHSYDNNIKKLSTVKGLHSYFENNTNQNVLAINNPILKQGVSSGYDYINNTALFSFLQGNKSFTLSLNENLNIFESFYDYIPSFYLSKGDNLLSTNFNNDRLYKHFEGQYNVFYDQYYPSYITLMLNPEADLDCVFDNIQFKSELYLNDIDQPERTLTHIQAFNEYQNSGLIPLELGRNKNLRRKFRDWHALIPRDKRNRIRNPWIFLKLQLDNTSNYKMILHDIIVYYTV